MVDRVYRATLPRLRTELEELRGQFATLGSTKTDWIGLRIDPLLEHLESLEKILRSEGHMLENSRLREGVAMFHADLVYLRANVKGLNRVLQSERRKSVAVRHLDPRRNP